MRLPALLIGLLLLAAPAIAAPGDGCGSMLEPAAQLHNVSRGFSRYHSGVDLMAPYGSPIRAAAGGTVVYAGWYFAYGKIVDIQHADGLITRYAHMSAFAPGIAKGRPVAAGQVIGRIGTTGNAHGPHVHFEVRVNGHPVDPKPYIGLAACQGTPRLPPVEEARAPEPRAPLVSAPPAQDRRDH
jgi:murein DD-endopeptidase MepM/ murein hydrolase activator NlpD